MLGISERAANMQPSATLQLTAKVSEMTHAGIEVIKFNIGEPDFDTPVNIRNACKKALDDGKTRYTPAPGIVELRRAICDKLERDNNVRYGVSEISFGTGAKQPIFNTLFMTVNPGDEVIIPTPCWVSYVDMVKLCGGVPVLVSCKEEDGFSLDIDAIAAAVTDKTKAIIINTPNNPSGAVYDEASLRQLAELALTCRFYIISDEVYEKLIYDGEKHFCIASISEEVKALSFIVNGFSKAYAMTGWRAGYVAGPADIIGKINGFQGHSTSNASTPVQWACIEALNGPQDSLKTMLVQFDERRKYLSRRLNEMGFSCKTPKGAFYVMPNISALFEKSYKGKKLADSAGTAEFMLEAAHIAVVPGEAFASPNNVRFAYSNSLSNIEKGLGQLDAALKQLD
ncbi:MAG: pyridoxal phosphate-dependent aminotransferase [Synergistaceae bacterium]|nr:pyridoxal phosphate-dependent aminotransferase [Synergistaceae bacterium]